MTYLAVLMPVAGHSEEGDDIWGCLAVHTNVDASYVVLNTYSLMPTCARKKLSAYLEHLDDIDL